MVQMITKLGAADNSGAKKLNCVKVLGGSKKMSAGICDEIIVSVREAVPNGRVKEGDVYKAVIVRTKRGTKRSDGSSIRFDSNDVVLLTKEGELVGTRIFGAVPRELRLKGYMRIISLAPEVL